MDVSKIIYHIKHRIGKYIVLRLSWLTICFSFQNKNIDLEHCFMLLIWNIQFSLLQTWKLNNFTDWWPDRSSRVVTRYGVSERWHPDWSERQQPGRSKSQPGGRHPQGHCGDYEGRDGSCGGSRDFSRCLQFHSLLAILAETTEVHHSSSTL